MIGVYSYIKLVMNEIWVDYLSKKRPILLALYRDESFTDKKKRKRIKGKYVVEQQQEQKEEDFIIDHEW